MRSAPVWLRNPAQGTRQILAVVISSLLLWCAGSRGASLTARGVQCPTAAVQTVAVAKRDCCGRLVGYEVRKPTEGEKGFKQCRCQEKRQGAVQAEASPRNESLPSAVLAFSVPPAIPAPWTEYAYLARSSAWTEPPAIRPPAAS